MHKAILHTVNVNQTSTHHVSSLLTKGCDITAYSYIRLISIQSYSAYYDERNKEGGSG